MINEQSLQSLEKLHQMKTDGIISDEDYDKAKQRILDGKEKQTARVAVPSGDVVQGEFDDWVGWAKLPLQRYADFTGRSRRKEYWIFMLIPVAIMIVSIVLAIVSASLGVVVWLLASLAIFIPQLAVTVRRFHDQDKSGWFVLLLLAPFGVIAVFIFMLLPGTVGANSYGDDPIED